MQSSIHERLIDFIAINSDLKELETDKFTRRYYRSKLIFIAILNSSKAKHKYKRYTKCKNIDIRPLI